MGTEKLPRPGAPGGGGRKGDDGGGGEMASESCHAVTRMGAQLAAATAGVLVLALAARNLPVPLLLGCEMNLPALALLLAPAVVLVFAARRRPKNQWTDMLIAVACIIVAVVLDTYASGGPWTLLPPLALLVICERIALRLAVSSRFAGRTLFGVALYLEFLLLSAALRWPATDFGLLRPIIQT